MSANELDPEEMVCHVITPVANAGSYSDT